MMDHLTTIHCAVTKLKENCLATQVKMFHFCKLKNCLVDTSKQKNVITDKELLDQIFQLANSEVMNENSDLQQVVLNVLELLYQSNGINLTVDVPDMYVKLAYENSGKHKKNVKNSALNCLRSCIKKLILENHCNLEKLYISFDQMNASDKMFDLLLHIIMDIPVKSCLLFYYQSIVPAMFESKNVQLRNILIKLGVELVPRFSMHFLSKDELELFKENIRSYVHRIREIRHENDSNWHLLFKFLLKCFGKSLHSFVDLMNDLLKIVEGAFRSNNLDDRFCAFDCWKELIDNYSLDMERLCGNKQMKLLITPLKTNVSASNHSIVYKRFEIWAHLINIVQEKSLPYLELFFTFCFGAEDDATTENSDNGNKSYKFYVETTLALLEIIGHFGHSNENKCLKYPIKLIDLKQPLINSQNFKDLESFTIRSIGKCTSLLFQWMDHDDIPNVIRCMWGSLMEIVKGLGMQNQEKAVQRIMIELVVYIQTSKQTLDYLQYVIKPVLQVLASEKFFDAKIFNKLVFFPLIKCLLNYGGPLFLSNRETIVDLINYSKEGEEKDKWFKQMYEIFSKFDITTTFNILLVIWLECTDNLLYICDHQTDVNNKVLRNTIIEFMNWPILDMHKLCSRQPALYKECVTKWSGLFEHLAQSRTKETLTIINKLDISIATGVVGSISLFYNSFCSILTNVHDFDHALLNLTIHMLEFDKLSDANLEAILPIMPILSEKIAAKCDSSTFITLCNCHTTLIKKYEKYNLLDSLEKCIETISESRRHSIPSQLNSALSELVGNSNKKISYKAEQLLKKIKLDKTFIKPSHSSRGRKMIAMTGKDSVSKIEGEPTVLRLFGQNVSSPTHNNIRGSQLADKSTPTKRKAVNKLPDLKKSPVLPDDDNANYVAINSEYKFDKTKLSEHQLEVLKKPKADIPALYQDLSQSQSNSLCPSLITKNEDKPNHNQSPDLFYSEDQAQKEESDSKSIMVNDIGVKDLDMHNLKTEEKENLLESLPVENKEERVNLHVRNPSQEQIEAMITGESHTGTQCVSTINDIKKRERVEKELHKLKLDLVGGDYLDKIDLMGKRSTRRKSDLNFKQYKFLKVIDSPSSITSGVSRFSPIKSKQKFETPPSKKPRTISSRRLSETAISKKQESVRKSLVELLDKANEESSNKKIIETTENSEDVIGSSQDNCVGINLTNKVLTDTSNEIKELNSEIKEIVSTITQLNSESVEPMKEVIEANIDLTEDNPNTCGIETKSLQFDIPKQITTPKKMINISSSPVHMDTPTRNSELIQDTENISPIKLDVTHATPDLFDSEARNLEVEEENINHFSKEQEPITVEYPSLTVDPELSIVHNEITELGNGLSTRSAKLLKLVSWKPPPPANKRSQKLIKKPAAVSSKTHRIMKMMQKCEKKLQFHEQSKDGLGELESDDENEREHLCKDLLEFVRELPSPKASPRCSILKRKASEINEDGFSPPRKQKRVNFPDPPLTCKKVYIPNENEHITDDIINDITLMDVKVDEIEINKNDNIVSNAEITDIIVTNVVNTNGELDEIKTEDLPDTESQGSVEVIDVRLLDKVEPVFANLIECKDSIEEIVTSLSDPLFANSLLDVLKNQNIVTVGDLAKLSEIEINRLPIKSPKLMNLRTVLTNYQTTKQCQDTEQTAEASNVNDMVKWINQSQSKAPTKKPKLQRRISLKPVSVGNCPNCNNFKPIILTRIYPNSSETMPGVQSNTKEIINLIKQNVIQQTLSREELCRTVFSIIEPDFIIRLLQERNSLSIGQLVRESDWPELLEKIVRDASLQKLLDWLSAVPNVTLKDILNACIDHLLKTYCENLPKLEEEAVRLLEVLPVSVILNHFGIKRIINELHLMCIKLNFSVEDFFKHTLNTFNPSIEDIVPSFQYINFVEVNNKTIKRENSKEKDLINFVEKILMNVDNTKVSEKIPKNAMLPLFNECELTDAIITTSSISSIVKSCEKLVQHLPKAGAKENEYESLALSIFDKIPTGDLCRYFAKHLNKFADTVQNPD